MGRLVRLVAGCLAAAGLALIIPACAARPAVIQLANYQRSDGAITVQSQGDFVDPYFAAKALLSARQLGLETTEASRRWIEWALPMQLADGRFARYCLTDAGARACKPADADDSALALWLELLALTAAGPLPPHWQDSFERAAAALERLLDAPLGVYRVFADDPTALLMDNCEVYTALGIVADHFERLGQADTARTWRDRQNRLAVGINGLFWQPASGSYRVSNEAVSYQGFYPLALAQLYPILHNLPTGSAASRDFGQWYREHARTWFRNAETDYPWGLVAQAAHQRGQGAGIGCWLTRAPRFRHGERWNVLEEAIFQALANHTPRPSADDCPQDIR